MRVFSQYVAVKSILLLVLEGLIAAFSLIGATWLRFFSEPEQFTAMLGNPIYWLRVLVVVVALLVAFYCNKLYDFNALRSRQEYFRQDQMIRLVESVAYVCFPLALLYYFVPDLMLGRGIALISIALMLPLIAWCRLAVSSGVLEQKVLIIGAGELAEAVSKEFSSRADLHLSVVGFLTGPDRRDAMPAPGCRVLGAVEDLMSVARSTQANRIIVALQERRRALPVRDLVRLRMEGVEIEDAQTAMASLSGRVSLSTIQPSWFVFSDGFRRSEALFAIKRTIDFVCAILGLILTLPIMAIVALAIKLDSEGPAMYRQRRVGLAGRVFEVLKFRSMRTDAEKDGPKWASSRDSRITRIGGFLRKYRFDELPQFWNVIRGDMSFVGPRPERPEFVEQLREVIPYYDERHTVRPGITGWAQVQYEYGASVEAACRKLEYDLFYLKNMSALFDLRIIYKTIETVLTGKGAH
ncbi:MAG: TIGR03013 family PEP-CTERM/XrtA system glycosyltransferase [Bryobacterales bacterium]|nr:TIGR03013 family PEP-CTERM/XrtA system glycosyltransferase [Bryobacterales bacterium]MBV9397655.1 TIGR03013 family PEP-CTERM/XrtA system glycosyltransferase [Bryobacterales bacterium]